MINVRILFNANPKKFKETAKGKTYNEFISYLESVDNFDIIRLMTEKEKRELYTLSYQE